MTTSSIITLHPIDLEQGMRVDKFIALRLDHLSRTRIKALINTDYLTIDNVIINDCSATVKLGSIYQLIIPPPSDTEIKPNNNLSINVIYEDSHLLIINKQAGLTTHPGAGNHQDTLVNALLAYYGKNLSAVGGRLRPGIVHRLDKDTSGLMIVAKNDHAHYSLTNQLSARKLSRTYIAVVWGVPTPLSGTINTQIARHAIDRKKMAVVKNGGKEAITNYKVEKILANQLASIIECKLTTGRTHQIRVHLSHLGHSLIGDQVYGNNKRKLSNLSPESQLLLNNFKRQALHAIKIGFIHPITREIMEFSSVLPDDISKLIAELSK